MKKYKCPQCKNEPDFDFFERELFATDYSMLFIKCSCGCGATNEMVCTKCGYESNKKDFMEVQKC